jgi:hypothetical protein
MAEFTEGSQQHQQTKMMNKRPAKNAIVEGRSHRQQSSIQIRKSKRTVEQKQRREDDRPPMDISFHLLKECALDTYNGMNLLRRCTTDPTPEILAYLFDQQLIRLVLLELENNDNLNVLVEGVWALSNLCCVDDLYVQKLVIYYPVINVFCHLFIHSPHEFIREQAIIGCGNLAIHSGAYAKEMIENGVMEKLISDLYEPLGPTLLNNETWALAMFCRHRIYESDDKDKQLMEGIRQLLFQQGLPKQVYHHLALALCRLIERSEDLLWIFVKEDYGRLLIDSGLLKLDHQTTAEQLETGLKLLGTVAESKFTNYVIEIGGWDILHQLLDVKDVQQTAAWVLSNMCVDSHPPDAICQQVTELLRDAPLDTRKELVWVLHNLLGDWSWFRGHFTLVTEIAALGELLEYQNDVDHLIAVMDTLLVMFAKDERDEVKQLIEMTVPTDMVDKLIDHPNSLVRSKAGDLEALIGDGYDE